ncbi:MAG: OmpH family outer membrane protein [Chlamydiae bacterium]|nr:OmpH family outer membrane protein [Chlamydiota bacterium]
MNKYKNRLMGRILFLLGICTASLAGAENIGVVNFTDCITKSKVGKAEQTHFENLKKQLGSYLENVEKELKDVAGKLNDAEYMDGLSPEAGAELRAKAQGLNEEMMRYQNQYYQTLNQANSKIVQQLGSQVASAAESVAKEKNLTIVLNQDACFYRDESVDITDQVVQMMDEMYDKQAPSADTQKKGE